MLSATISTEADDILKYFLLTLSTLGKIFNSRHIQLFFLFYPRKQALVFLLWRPFASNIKRKIRKISSICCL